MDYPLRYSVSYRERHSRLSTLFRWVIAIPWLVWLWLWATAFGVLLVLMWFVLVFTARWPGELWGFAAAYLRFQAQVTAWLLLLTDRFPGWLGKPDPDFGVELELRPQETYNRWKVGFRWLLALPAALIASALGYYAALFAFLAWFAILFTGRRPAWCYRQLADSTAYMQRFNAYQYLLVEPYPPLAGMTERPGAAAELEAGGGAPLPRGGAKAARPGPFPQGPERIG